MSLVELIRRLPRGRARIACAGTGHVRRRQGRATRGMLRWQRRQRHLRHRQRLGGLDVSIREGEGLVEMLGVNVPFAMTSLV